MARRNIIVGLDVGTTKTAVVISELYRESQVHLLGIGTSPSRGLKQGQVVDIVDTSEAIQTAAAAAEHASGIRLDRVCIGIAGGHLISHSQRAELRLRANERQVVDRHVDRVVRATANIQPPEGREIVAVIPKSYSVDDLSGISNPCGLSGRRLAVDAHVVTGAVNAMTNLENSLKLARLGVEVSVLQPLASAQACLTKEQRQDGVALIDIGGGTTDIAVFMNDHCWHISVLPLGGQIVTSDISRGLRLPMTVAEQLKVKHGRIDSRAAQDRTPVTVPGFDRGAPTNVRMCDLTEVIEARMIEILQHVKRELVHSGYQQLLPAGAVLTGGGSQLSGLPEMAMEILGMPITLGRPPALWGLEENIRRPEFCTGIGLSLAGLEARSGAGLFSHEPKGVNGTIDTAKRWVKGMLTPRPEPEWEAE